MKIIQTFIFFFLLPLLFSDNSETVNLSIDQNNVLNPFITKISEDYHYTKNNDISNDDSSILINVKLEDNNATIIIGEEITDKETGAKM